MRNFPAVTWSPVWSWGTCSGQVRRSEAEILRCDRSDFRSIHVWSGPLEQIMRGSKPAIYRNQAPPLVHPCDQAVSTSLMSETHHTGRQAGREAWWRVRVRGRRRSHAGHDPAADQSGIVGTDQIARGWCQEPSRRCHDKLHPCSVIAHLWVGPLDDTRAQHRNHQTIVHNSASG